jgi:hypothetical protein
MNKRVCWSAVVILAISPLAGCQQEGPAEQAGQKVDNVVRDVKDAVNPPGPMEKAGRAVDDAVNKK